MEQNSASRAAPQLPAYSTARKLGWFSLGLGAAQLLMPGTLNRALGVSGKKWMTRSCGAREVAAGLGLFATRRPAPWLWMRSAGDAADLAALAALARRGRRGRKVALVAFAAVAGITALDLITARRLQGRRWPARAPTHDYSDRSGFRQSPQAMRGVAARALPAAPGAGVATPVAASQAAPRSGSDTPPPLRH